MELAPFLIYFFFIFLFSTFISGVLYSRISVKYINSKMEEDGVYPPCWDKGIGASVSFYIFAMFFERSRIPTPMFDGRFVAKYTRTLDKIIGAIHLVSIIGAVLSLCIITFLKHS